MFEDGAALRSSVFVVSENQSEGREKEGNEDGNEKKDGETDAALR